MDVQLSHTKWDDHRPWCLPDRPWCLKFFEISSFLNVLTLPNCSPAHPTQRSPTQSNQPSCLALD